ncbi:hypothetical protein LQZ18_08640 [Lachnospiraceae bacterium ZAX-1]
MERRADQAKKKRKNASKAVNMLYTGFNLEDALNVRREEGIKALVEVLSEESYDADTIQNKNTLTTSRMALLKNRFLWHGVTKPEPL